MFKELEEHVQIHSKRYFVCARRNCKQIFFDASELQDHVHTHYKSIDGGKSHEYLPKDGKFHMT